MCQAAKGVKEMMFIIPICPYDDIAAIVILGLLFVALVVWYRLHGRRYTLAEFEESVEEKVKGCVCWIKNIFKGYKTPRE